MKFIISLILTSLLSFVACLYLPWWSIAVAAFIVAAVVSQKPFVSFLTGFMALFLLWGYLAWYLSNNNGHLLAHKMSMVVIGMVNPIVLILMTALVGAIVAGFSALAGSYVQKRTK